MKPQISYFDSALHNPGNPFFVCMACRAPFGQCTAAVGIYHTFGALLAFCGDDIWGKGPISMCSGHLACHGV